MLKQTQNKNATMWNQTLDLIIKQYIEPYNEPLFRDNTNGNIMHYDPQMPHVTRMGPPVLLAVAELKLTS
jgi:hypothetical protein